MPFSDDVKQSAFQRSSGRCECGSTHTGTSDPLHRGGRCPSTFNPSAGWDVRPKVAELAGGKSTVDNAEVLCLTCTQQRYPN
ncbi:MAG: hypothetical protein HW403_816 [Dehalococcoidia bacterium]|nr:hypothetical protein [Dehalococcoidia bacterium]